MWGDSEQTSSFCQIDNCLEEIYCLIMSDHRKTLNLGQDHLASINELADMVAEIARIKIVKKNVPDPQGVRGQTVWSVLVQI